MSRADYLAQERDQARRSSSERVRDERRDLMHRHQGYAP